MINTSIHGLMIGGDEHGHPGIALYRSGFFLLATVSTGDRYWTVLAAGVLRSNEWTNIAIRWLPESDNEDDKGLTVSLFFIMSVFIYFKYDSCDHIHHQMFINGKSVARTMIGKSSLRKDSLDPKEIMFGCHRTSSNKQYRNFGSGQYDEFALWPHALADQDLYFFMGGYGWLIVFWN